MYNNYQIVANTAAGRRRYMQWLIPFVVASDIIDRYDIWVNTHDSVDIEFFKRIAAAFPKVQLVWQPDGIVCGNNSINAFYRQCTEEQTIYIKLDDDIVWMEPDLIEKMVRFRVEHPEYFLVSPLVINNSLSTYLLQVHGKLKLDKYYQAMATHPVFWKSGEFATQLHHWFLQTQLKTGRYAALHVGPQPMGMTRFSINCILWFGSEMKKMNGEVPGDDEEYLSSIYPTRHGLANCWNGDALAAHFAFFPQREQLDKAGVLQQYGKYLSATWKKDEKMGKVHRLVQEAMQYCADHEESLRQIPSPYKRIKEPTRRRFTKPVRRFFKKLAAAIRRGTYRMCHRGEQKYMAEYLHG